MTEQKVIIEKVEAEHTFGKKVECDGLVFNNGIFDDFMKIIIKGTEEFYKIPENRAKFEQFYLEKYGKPYVWDKKFTTNS